MQITMNAIDQFGGAIGDVMQSVVSIVVGTDGTLIYIRPLGRRLRGDSRARRRRAARRGRRESANGYPPGYPGDVLRRAT
jgi:hypothetical protein